MEFLQEFDFNKKYVFDKDIYEEYMSIIGNDGADRVSEKYWTDLCHNKEVQLISSSTGKTEDFLVVPSWCREVASPIRLMNENDFE